MTHRVRFSQEALSDLEAIAAHLHNEAVDVGPEIFRSIHRIIYLLADFPHLGRESEVQDARKIPVAGVPYIIVYAFNKAELWILRIYHSSRDMRY